MADLTHRIRPLNEKYKRTQLCKICTNNTLSVLLNTHFPFTSICASDTSIPPNSEKKAKQSIASLFPGICKTLLCFGFSYVQKLKNTSSDKKFELPSWRIPEPISLSIFTRPNPKKVAFLIFPFLCFCISQKKPSPPLNHLSLKALPTKTFFCFVVVVCCC